MASAPEPAALPAPSAGPLTVKQLAQQYPAFSESSTRWAIFNSESNGLAKSGAVIRMGRRILIDPTLYLAWLRTNPRLSPPAPKGNSRPKPAAVLGDEPPARRRAAQAQG
jgi:hypothetical protein